MDLENNTEVSLDWRKYVDMIFRHKWLIVFPTLVGIGVAIFLTMTLPKVYKASTLVLIEDKQLLKPLIEGLAITTSVEQRLFSLGEEILSYPRLMKLVEQLEL